MRTSRDDEMSVCCIFPSAGNYLAESRGALQCLRPNLQRKGRGYTQAWTVCLARMCSCMRARTDVSISRDAAGPFSLLSLLGTRRLRENGALTGALYRVYGEGDGASTEADMSMIDVVS